MKKFLVATFVGVLSPVLASAFILPTKTILQKTSDNAGSGIYAIEQEVQFANGDDTIHLRETWLIDNDRTMRLTVTGTKELQGNFRMQFLYAGGQRWTIVNGSKKNEKTPEDFLEKYLNFRSSENFAATLANLKIIPHGAYSKRMTVKKGDDVKYEPEGWVRYSRTGGVVNYAFGQPTPEDDKNSNPGLWIEQDQFVIRKIRLPSQVEMTADNYNQFAKGLYYPRTRTIRWGNNTATIRLISASARPATAVSQFQPNSLDINTKLDGLEKLSAKDAVMEFYSRFR
ncbi:hypothetical protein B9G69_008770 [Bdellovibrio sp. SKB1291214]|uniref:hypothetical protein n=1 Tax=Bdellovibrio sp. SKB1291214 TaxID=1732569 RepID=UPI000B518E92|nr:hypothetical protein [Bdellovibrio sp. SKB1291214]UYL10666.1 hypothetical protein B9G69_008770 [Bdellovibrio sp. SKB1291214]